MTKAIKLGPVKIACWLTQRPVIIQILEFFDPIGYTRRVRDDYVLRRS